MSEHGPFSPVTSDSSPVCSLPDLELTPQNLMHQAYPIKLVPTELAEFSEHDGRRSMTTDVEIYCISTRYPEIVTKQRISCSEKSSNLALEGNSLLPVLQHLNSSTSP